MKPLSSDSKSKKIGVLMVAVFLSAPFGFLRLHGDDYSQGSSFALVDVFLFCAGIHILLMSMRADGIPHIKLCYVSIPLLFVGILFMMLSLLSGLEGLLIYDINVHLGPLFSGIIQYAFIMLYLPLVASHFLSVDKLRNIIRYICLGYLLPMLFTLLFLSHDTPERMREIFFFSNRALGSYGNANTFSGLIVMILPYYIFLAVTEKGFWRAIGYASVSLSLLCLFLTVSFSGMLILIIVIILNVLFAIIWRGHQIHKYKTRLIHLVMSTVFFVITISVIALASMPSILEDVSTRLFFLDASNTKNVDIENLGSGKDRLELIDLSLQLIKNRNGGLLWGHGMRQTQAIPEFSFSGDPVDVHLLYLLLWIEGGGVLLLLFGAYLLFLFRNIIALAEILPFEAVVIGNVFIGLVLLGMFYPHMYMRFFWMPLLPAFVNWRGYLRDYRK